MYDSTIILQQQNNTMIIQQYNNSTTKQNNNSTITKQEYLERDEAGDYVHGYPDTVDLCDTVRDVQ